MESDAQAVPAVRNAKGQWVKGTSGSPNGPGPRGSYGIDLRHLARRKMGEAGYAERMWQVIQRMFDAAMDGDVAAAKLLFDRLGVPEAKASLKMTVDLTPDERAARIQQLLGQAAARRVEVELLEEDDDEP